VTLDILTFRNDIYALCGFGAGSRLRAYSHTEERIMMNLHILVGQDATPAYSVVRKIGPADLKDALTKGVNDFLPFLDFLASYAGNWVTG
jgi:hypothetical protein